MAVTESGTKRDSEMDDHNPILDDMLALPPSPAEPIAITDAELDAATLAYMDVRYPGGAEAWRKAWPTAWRELRDRMRFALLAAAAVRAS
jgi:hypothetical protein